MCKRQKFSKICEACQNDCKEPILDAPCEHYKRGIDLKMYKQLIRNANLNIGKLCDRYGISRNIMYNMLADRQHFTYKYRTILNSALFELDCFLPYCEVEDGEE